MCLCKRRPPVLPEIRSTDGHAAETVAGAGGEAVGTCSLQNPVAEFCH